jgi:hypothetical protein
MVPTFNGRILRKSRQYAYLPGTNTTAYYTKQKSKLAATKIYKIELRGLYYNIFTEGIVTVLQ